VVVHLIPLTTAARTHAANLGRVVCPPPTPVGAPAAAAEAAAAAEGAAEVFPGDGLPQGEGEPLSAGCFQLADDGILSVSLPQASVPGQSWSIIT